MDKGYNNIDKVFKKELGGFYSTAPDGVWENIELHLDAKRKSKLLSYYKFAAAAVVLALIGSVFVLSNKKVQFDKEYVAQSPATELVQKDDVVKEIEEVKEKGIAQESIAPTETNEVTQSEFITSNQIAKVQTSNKEKAQIQNAIINDDVENEPEKMAGDEEIIISRDRITALEPLNLALSTESVDHSIIYKEKETISLFNKSFDLANAYAALDNLNADKKSMSDRWSVGGEFSPTYSYRLITNNNLTSEYYNSVEKPITSYSGGVNVQYKAKKRLTVETGVYYASIGQALDNMSVYSNQAYNLVPDEYKDRYARPYELENSVGAIDFNTPYVVKDNKGTRVNDLSNNKVYSDVSDPIFKELDAEIQQNFQYLEVPVILRYKLIDRLVDLNIIGGLGANFLIGNNVYLVQGNAREVVGETKNVNEVNYTSTLGFGIEYPVLKQISISLEPSLKYYLNGVSSNSDVKSHPYTFGIFTGISYSF